MKKNKNTQKFKFSIILLAFFGTVSYCQETSLPIWNKPIPSSIDVPSYLEKEIIKEGELQSISQVTKPLLYKYQPKKTVMNGSVVLICPGGGYSHLAKNKEGKKVALWLNSMGITAFVLKYRMPNDLIMKDKSIGPLQDAQEAIRTIRRNAKEWNIDPAKIGVLGFSAGGHLASTLATHYLDRMMLM